MLEHLCFQRTSNKLALELIIPSCSPSEIIQILANLLMKVDIHPSFSSFSFLKNYVYIYSTLPPKFEVTFEKYLQYNENSQRK
jgi:hypothetical protein